MRQWLKNDATLKILSLVLAVLTWFFVNAMTSDSRMVEGVPIEIHVKPGMAVETSSAKTVNVTVRGTTEDMRLASRNELYTVLDLTHEDKPGTMEIPINVHAVRHPRRIRVVEVEPSKVTVRLTPVTE